MEKHVQIFLNKLSFACITIATFTLLLLFLENPSTCLGPPPPYPSSKRVYHRSFPKSTCDYSHRSYISVEKRNKRLWSSKTWIHTVHSYTILFSSLQAQAPVHNIHRLSNHSRALVVSAGPGHAVMALNNMGVADVTGLEVVESLPLVSRCDLHSLPFFDNVFDFGFSGYLDRSLFPARYVAEMERTVRRGGACVVAVEECGDEEVKDVVKLFKNSRFLDAQNVTIAGELRTRILMRVEK
ncbi:hypothetical protein M9H77_20051 [Catharanthus roseus]|uniref:Uncharacterized protein n=1 Tax=Catharanthus roseus TaxID=4058 RepID=A0ACC0AMS0_CATRO|nr:hypothetical protein M9H77_20051 [Catharanthus roseus]